MLSTIVTLLEESIAKKPAIEKLADKISGYFSFVVLTLAILTFIGWYIGGAGFEKALIISISVIVIACPCALGLATPMAALIGINSASKKGILFKEAEFLETMAKSDTMVLDKTGTITEGKPKVVNAKFLKDFDINLLYSLVKSSKHPISKAIVRYLKDKSNDLNEYFLKNVKNLEARGLKAEHKNIKLFGGNLELIKELNIPFSGDFKNTVFIFVVDDKVVAYFELKDSTKEGAKKAISQIKKMGMDVIMLTGDNEQASREIAKEVGIKKVYHSLFPKGKAQMIDTLHEEGKKVVMAGDGLNDALALSRSDIAISMGSGADVSVEVSDVVILNDDIKGLAQALKISKKSYATIKENFAISVLYNSITIPLAISGHVMPFVAALSMSVSSLIVVGNSFRIKRLK